MTIVLDEDVEFLAHYGVKGMQWGKRKAEDVSSDSDGVKTQPSVRKRLASHNLKVNTERHNMLKARAAKADIRISEINSEMTNVRRFSSKWQDLRYEKNVTTEARDRDLKKATKPPTSGLTSTQKKVLVGAGVAAVLVGYSLAARKYGDSEGMGAAYRAARSQVKYGDTFKPNPALARKMTPEEVLAHISKDVNPNYRSLGGQMNCRRATFAHELRRRGYDVQATTSAIGYGQNETGMLNALIKGDKNIPTRQSLSSYASAWSDTGIRTRGAAQDLRVANATRQSLSNLDYFQKTSSLSSLEGTVTRRLREAFAIHPKGARGEVVFDFGGFAHSMQWEIFDDGPHIFDSQKGQHFPVVADGIYSLMSKWGKPTMADLTRLDNVDLDLEFLSRWVKNNG